MGFHTLCRLYLHELAFCSRAQRQQSKPGVAQAVEHRLRNEEGLQIAQVPMLLQRANYSDASVFKKTIVRSQNWTGKTNFCLTVSNQMIEFGGLGPGNRFLM